MENIRAKARLDICRQGSESVLVAMLSNDKRKQARHLSSGKPVLLGEMTQVEWIHWSTAVAQQALQKFTYQNVDFSLDR